MIENIEHPYPLLLLTVVGSRAFGFGTEWSDYDIHGVHRLALEHILGFAHGNETIEKKLTDRHEISTHDIKKFLYLLMKGNGNVLEDLYSPIVLFSLSSFHDEIKPLARGCITKRCADHYRGMAYNQQRRMRLNDVKKFLHCFRCLLMGIHLMRSRRIEMNLPLLAQDYGIKEIKTLIQYKQEGIEGVEKGELPVLEKLLADLYERLEEEQMKSILPDFTAQTTKDQLEDLLIRIRLNNCDGILF